MPRFRNDSMAVTLWSRATCYDATAVDVCIKCAVKVAYQSMRGLNLVPRGSREPSGTLRPAVMPHLFSYKQRDYHCDICGVQLVGQDDAAYP